MDKQCCTGYEHSSMFLEKREDTARGIFTTYICPCYGSHFSDIPGCKQVTCHKGAIRLCHVVDTVRMLPLLHSCQPKFNT